MRKNIILILSIVMLFILAILVIGYLGLRDFCPPWKSYRKESHYGPAYCYFPASDFEKVCYQASDCKESCLVNHKNPLIKSCSIKSRRLTAATDRSSETKISFSTSCLYKSLPY